MKFHILITEDDENVANGLSDILKSYGYQVSVSDNSADTIEILNRENIALVILDVCLGEDSGYDLCKKSESFRMFLFFSHRLQQRIRAYTGISGWGR